MSDVIESLKRLAPSAMDRDTLLVHAARASVRPSPVWKWLAGGLAVSQVATLGLWWAMANGQPARVESVEPPRIETMPEAASPEPFSYLAMNFSPESPPRESEIPSPDERRPILTAGQRSFD
jgi:hypothetical protein